MDKGMKKWAQTASEITHKAASTKDWRLRRKIDRRFKEIAQELSQGKGYIIASEKELAEKWPEVFVGRGWLGSDKFIWAVMFSDSPTGNKMKFVAIR